MPTIVADWSGTPENLEGVAWGSDGSVYIVSDNYFKGKRFGPSRIFRVMDLD